MPEITSNKRREASAAARSCTGRFCGSLLVCYRPLVANAKPSLVRNPALNRSPPDFPEESLRDLWGSQTQVKRGGRPRATPGAPCRTCSSSRTGSAGSRPPRCLRVGALNHSPKTTGFPRRARASDVRRGLERRRRRIEPALFRGPATEGRRRLVVARRRVGRLGLMGSCRACSVSRRRHGQLRGANDARGRRLYRRQGLPTSAHDAHPRQGGGASPWPATTDSSVPRIKNSSRPAPTPQMRPQKTPMFQMEASRYLQPLGRQRRANSGCSTARACLRPKEQRAEKLERAYDPQSNGTRRSRGRRGCPHIYCTYNHAARAPGQPAAHSALR